MVDRERPDLERSVLRAWGDVIRKYRQWKQYSRRDLGQKAGLSPVFLGEIERGEKDPSSHTLCLIAEGLEVSLAELYLRVAARMDGVLPVNLDGGEQTSLPRGVRDLDGEFLDAVPPARDETAFDLYKVARLLRSDQQVAVLLVAQSLARLAD